VKDPKEYLSIGQFALCNTFT